MPCVPNCRKQRRRKRAALNRQRNANRPQPPRPVGEILTADAITWPKALQDEKLSPYRDRVNLALEEKASTGKVSAADSQKVQEMTADILDSLKADIRTIRPQDYIGGKTFRPQSAGGNVTPAIAQRPLTAAGCGGHETR